MRKLTPFEAVEAIRHRSVEAILGLSGLSHAALAEEIRRRFGSRDIARGAVVQEPVLEAAYPFVEAELTVASLSGTLLHPKLVDALDQPGDPRIGKDWHPYAHQLEAWQRLTASDPQSVLVTSGTGSGKTECFMVPLLNDLVSEAEQQATSLSGVRAIVLYPLNALIASQQERLGKWTRPFGGRIRYALYNGEMPEDDKEARERNVPEQVLCRRTLRENPPPILVTNVTMLEYLTVRRKDRPILDASQGKLRWIILDEAHSYTGSNAAEIALLLRRALLSFGVTPEQVRFVATSATIGEGTDVTEELQTFLRDVSGAERARVHVIVGNRRMPSLPPPDQNHNLGDIPVGELGPEAAFECLSRNPVAQNLVTQLTKGAQTWSETARELAKSGAEPEALALALARAQKNGEQLLPLRVHVFHRAIPGLWSCVNPSCDECFDGWPFGRILCEAVDTCPACGGIVLPITICRGCGEPFLDAVEQGRILHPKKEDAFEDDFARDSEEEHIPASDEDWGEQPVPGHARLIAVRNLPQARPLHIDPLSGAIANQSGRDLLTLWSHDREKPERCPCCQLKATDRQPRILYPFRFGAPAILSNASTVLLETTDPAKPNPEADHTLPAEGRQLLSFTDSRQGTARFSARLQNASERNHVRALIYFAVQDCMAERPDESNLAALEAAIAALKARGQNDEPALRIFESQLQNLTKRPAGLAWEALRNRLAERDEVSHWMRLTWAKRDPELFEDDVKGPERLADLMLLRELARRTRRANSLETMGLVSLRFKEIEKLHPERTPALLRDRGLTINDWRDFLYLALTIAARDLFAVKIQSTMSRWLYPGVPIKRLIEPNRERTSKREVPWPQVRAEYVENRGTLPRLLEVALGLDATQRGDRELINELLQQAWHDVQPLFRTPGGGDDLRLDLSKALIAPVETAWRCPVTRRVLDRVFHGFSPYGLRTGVTRGIGARAEPIEMPRHPAPFITRPGDEEKVRDWLAQDHRIRELRAMGVWTNLHDRIALGSPYFRSAEHSAQQPSRRLREYEAQFRRGEINILNCSTTMEMGVDIGSVSTVMMTNVPPSIANYRQRVGRAGRRRQATALAFTYCRDMPIDWEAFRTPTRFLGRHVAAPRVSLDSAPLVQRHVNALLLAAFIREQDGDASTAKAGAFFGFPADLRTERLPDPPSEQFRDWLARPSAQEKLASAVGRLVRGSVLEHHTDLFAAAASAVKDAEAAFRAEWEGLQSQASGMDRAAAKKAIGFQLQRLCGEFLLSDLANRGVLPGHGFPTAVVQFIHKDQPDKDEIPMEEDSPFRRRFFASRNLDQAINDYAPGADVVIDGLVYRSAGVTLNWKRPAGEADTRDIQSLRFVWRCQTCGAAGTQHTPVDLCPECGATGEALHQFEYLRPAGFAAENETVHADADIVSYVRPQPPIVAATGGKWIPLRLPKTGRIRTSASGIVFYANAGGETCRGYMVCLHCGRAQAEGDTENESFSRHKPLRYTKADDGGKCPGTARPFAIKRHLLLGHEIRTDVFELELNGLGHEGAAWAFGSAFRTALTRELGIELNEVGLWVEPRETAVGGRTYTIFLFDHAAGGAGFSLRAKDLFVKLLAPVRQLLDCKVDGCIHGCSACVVTPDLYDHQRVLNRRSALAFLDDKLHALAMPTADEQFTEGASFSDHLVDELASGSGRVIVWSDFLDLATLHGSSFLRLAASFQRVGRPLTVVLTQELLLSLDDATRLALRDLAIRYDITLRQGPAPRFKNGAVGIAATLEEGGGEIWASRDNRAGQLGFHWGWAAESPILRANWGASYDSEELPEDFFKPRPEATVLTFTKECDGPLLDFGRRMLGMVAPLLERVGGWRPGQLVSIQYFDRYLKNPLSVRLALEFISALSEALGDRTATRVSLVSEPSRPSPRLHGTQPWRIEHDWRSDSERAATIEALLGKFGLDASLILKRDRHARQVYLSFNDATSISLVFDQGFGGWSTRKDIPVRFDFGVPPEEQAERLRTLNATVQGPSDPSYIVVHREQAFQTTVML